MKFGDIPLDEAVGAILAHSVHLSGENLKKGTVLTATHIAALREGGHDHVIAAALETGDIVENDAAADLASAVAGALVEAEDAFTGRVNLLAATDGLFRVDATRVTAFNRVDEAVMLATLPDFAKVNAGDILATLKIIPYAVPESAIKTARITLGSAPLLSVVAFAPPPAVLIQTTLPGTRDKVLAKSSQVIGERLSELGGTLTGEQRCPHTIDGLASRLAETAGGNAGLVLITGASAITDRRDVIPQALEQAGGTVQHFGMPVDPGNLLMIGTLRDKPVIGLPGCARSPKLNGFDWVLQRIAAGLPMGREEITAMGAGGLLKDIPSRPQPRRAIKAAKTGKIMGLLLAAGQSRRMGNNNKLLLPVRGVPMIVHAANALAGSGITEIVAVTGHEPERIHAALAGRGVSFTHNPDYADGLSSSLAAGLEAIPDDTAAVLVMLGDMPDITAAHVGKIIAAFDPDEGREICVPTFKGKRGNPVLWGERFIPEMRALAGDVGARHLIGEYAELVHEVEMDDDAIFVDVDDQAAFAAVTGPT